MIPNGWSHATIESVCTKVTSGGTPSRKRLEFYGGDIPWVKTQELQDGWVRSTEECLTQVGLDSSSAKLLPANTILMAMYGATVGKLGVLADEMTCNQASCALIVNPEVASFRFLFYRLLLERSAITTLATGAAQQNLNAGTIKSAQLLFPPLEEQERIAGVLGAFDDLIETNRRLMAQIREVVRTAWLRALSNSPVEMSFFDAFDVRFGAPFAGSEFAPSGVGRPLIRIRDLKTLTPDTWTTQSRSDETVIESGDVLVGMDAEFVPTYWLGASGVLNQRVMRVKSQYGGAGLCCEALRDPMAFVQGYKTGTTVAHLNKADLQTLRVRIPDDKNRAVFDEATRGMIQAVVGLAQESDGLIRQRDELLPLLMSGKVRVRDVEATVS